jgi:hypothetical protein
MRPRDFIALAELFPQAAILVTQSGAIVAANRQARVEFPDARKLDEVLDAAPDELGEFLRRCSRTRSRSLGSFPCTPANAVDSTAAWCGRVRTTNPRGSC